MSLFWNKSQKAVQAVVTAVAERISEPTAEVIQREMVDAQDRIMQQVDEILSARESLSNPMGKRLAALGFYGTVDAKQQSANEEAIGLAEYQQRLHAEHALMFPGLKFIEEDVMDKLCAKYGLLIGNVSRFKGQVPEWAVRRLEEMSEGLSEYIVKHEGGGWMTSHMTKAEWKEYEKRNSKIRSDKRLMCRGSAGMRPNMGSSSDERFYFTRDEKVAQEYGAVHKRMPSLTIAAPKHQMEVRQGDRVVGHRIVTRDPIVCIEVRGGYVVLCAWGEEGQDPRVFNTENN